MSSSKKTSVQEKLLPKFSVIGTIIFISFMVAGQGFPPAKLFTLDIFAIYVPVITILLAIVFVVYVTREIAYEFTLFSVLIFFSYIILIPVLFQSHPANISEIFTYFSQGVIVFVISAVVRDRTQIQLVICALYVIMIILVGIAIWEFITGSHLSASRLSTDAYSGDYASTIYLNRNNFGFFLALLAPLLMYGFLSKIGEKYTNCILISLIGCGIVITILNGSRTATLSYILGIGIVLVGWYLRKIEIQIHRWPRIGLGAYFLSATASIVLPLTLSNPFNPTENSSLFTRWKLMSGGAEYIQAAFLKPAGLGMFEVVVPTAGETAPETAHNWATQLGVETGIIGLLLFIFAIGCLTDRLFSLYYNYKSNWALPFAASLLVFPITGLGPSNVLPQAPIFWVFVGLGISLSIISTNHHMDQIE